jgi:hypothetical protein
VVPHAKVVEDGRVNETVGVFVITTLLIERTSNDKFGWPPPTHITKYGLTRLPEIVN